MIRWAGWVVTGTLVAAAAYELALALGAGSLGPEPGDEVAGSTVVQGIALLAMIAAAALAASPGSSPWPVALYAPAAGAYLVAFYFSYDPYFAPDLRRYSEGNVAGRWIAVVAVVAVANGVLTWRLPRIGRFTTSAVMLLLLVTTVLAADGH
jgi:hypothetical protein